MRTLTLLCFVALVSCAHRPVATCIASGVHYEAGRCGGGYVATVCDVMLDDGTKRECWTGPIEDIPMCARPPASGQ